MQAIKKIRNTENLHIILWLLKDTAWLLNFKILGLIMIFPTIGVAGWLVYKIWFDLKERCFNLAVLAWICANSVWMVGEFYFNDSTRKIALCFFIIGFLSIGYFGVLKVFKREPKKEF